MNHVEDHSNQEVNHGDQQDETKMHELHQSYGTLLSLDQNLDIRVTIHQTSAVDLHEERFSMELDVCFKWKDPRLRNTPTTVWLPRESSLQGGIQWCKGSLSGSYCHCCGCFGGQRCSGLPFVVKIFKEGKDDIGYIPVQDEQAPTGP